MTVVHIMLWLAVYSSSYLGFTLQPVDMNIQNEDLYFLHSMISHKQFSNHDSANLRLVQLVIHFVLS